MEVTAALTAQTPDEYRGRNTNKAANDHYKIENTQFENVFFHHRKPCPGTS